MAEQRHHVDADDLADPPNRTHSGEERVTVSRADVPMTTETRSRPVGTVSREHRAHEYPARSAADELDVELPKAMNLRQDRVRWGPIVAGLVTALTSLLLLSLLGLALGLTTVNAGDAAAQGSLPEGAGRNSALWGALSALLSFLLGGYVAGKTSAVFDRNWGALNGALVFLLGVPVMLWLASQGLGAVLGSLGSFAGGLNADPGQVQNAAQNAGDQARQAAQNVQPIDVARAAERARNAAWGALAGSLLGLGASALGGYLGTRREVEVDRRTGRVSE